MTDWDAIRDQLAEVMAQETRGGARTVGQLADALLPVVQRIARDTAANELDAAGAEGEFEQIRARAAALRTEETP